MIARQSAVMRPPGSAARNPPVWMHVAGKIWPADMTGPRRGSDMSEVWAAADVDMRRKMRPATADVRSKMRRAATAANMRRKMGTATTADMRNAAATWVWTTAATWMATGTRTVLSLGVPGARR
jgi:hypothetical protein